MSSRSTTPAAYASREEQASVEIGETEISRPVALALVTLFLLLLVGGGASLVLAVEVRRDVSASVHGLGSAMRVELPSLSLLERVLAPNREVLAQMKRVEDSLDEGFPAAKLLRRPVQTAMAALGAGDEQVLIGRDGWLYYQPDVTALMGRGIDFGKQVPCIEAPTDFQAALAEHGIRLVLLPVPVKPTIHPKGLTGRSPEGAPLRVRGFARWVAELQARGIEVVDVAPALMASREAHGQAYLKRDTHWTPGAMDAAAAQVARSVQATLSPATDSRPMEAAPKELAHVGDTAAMLELGETHRLRTPESVVIRPVEGARSADAEVVVLGDSFANIYALEGMGWGADGGLAERIALHLGAPVRAFIRNDGGAWASRERFLHAVARGEIDLGRVRVVIWQFAERELAHGEWRTLALPTEHATRPAVPERAVEARLQLTGRLAAISDGPRRDAPYGEFIVKWHVVDVRDGEGELVEGLAELVVMCFGMKERVILPTAGLRPGGRVNLELRPWGDVESVYGAFNAGTLDDPMLELDLPLFWAEQVESLGQP